MEILSQYKIVIVPVCFEILMHASRSVGFSIQERIGPEPLEELQICARESDRRLQHLK
jgi:hypothetical protein